MGSDTTIERSYEYIINILHFGFVLQIRTAQTTWNTWNVEIPVLTHVQIQKGARFVKPHVQMAVSVLLVRQLTSANDHTYQGTKREVVPFLYHFTQQIN